MKKYLFVLFVITLFVSCHKSTTSYWFTGMQIIDTSYKLVKWVGQADNDWQINKYTISAQLLYTMKIDSVTDTAFWHHTTSGNVYLEPGVNPVLWDSGNVYYTFENIVAGTQCLFTYLVTDQYNTVLANNSYEISNGSYLPASIPVASSKVQPGQVYRIYYAFSARGNLYFATGWGDFGVCSLDSATGMVKSCF